MNGWVFGAGGKFGVTSSGEVWCSDIHATGGKIGTKNAYLDIDRGVFYSYDAAISYSTKIDGGRIHVQNANGDYLVSVYGNTTGGSIVFDGGSIGSYNGEFRITAPPYGSTGLVAYAVAWRSIDGVMTLVAKNQ